MVVDWRAWHDDYHQPDSVLSRRLGIVQRQIRQVLDGCAPGPVRVISLCTGQGHDLLGALRRHPRRADVTARLVELDAHNAALARQATLAAGLHQIDIVTGDAAVTRHYHGMVPAHIGQQRRKILVRVVRYAVRCDVVDAVAVSARRNYHLLPGQRLVFAVPVKVETHLMIAETVA